MRETCNMEEAITVLAKENMADLVGFAPAERFDRDNVIFRIFPKTRTVIGLGFQVLRGIYRGIVEGSTYYQYTTMGVENMEETIMPMAQMRIAMMLEEHGFVALPQRRHQQIMAGVEGVNPEVDYREIYYGREAEQQMNFLEAAVACGLGEEGFHHALLTEEFGPFVRCCFILTDAELSGTPQRRSHLCDRCGVCIQGCPGNAIGQDGTVDSWQCAVYYNGANGTKNPFMPVNAFAELEGRMEIIAGKARVTPERAKEILDHIYFYPPAQHAYPCSICGRACDVACYCHLEEKGILTKKYKTRFRKREAWHFSLDDFKET